MARTVRTYWDATGVLNPDHRDGSTGWIVSPRLDEKAAKKAAKAAAIRAAWAEAIDNNEEA